MLVLVFLSGGDHSKRRDPSASSKPLRLSTEDANGHQSLGREDLLPEEKEHDRGRLCDALSW